MARRKARSSWGSVSYDPKKRVGRIRYWAKTDAGYRRCSKTVRGSRKDVDAELARLMIEHSKDAPCPTVGQAWETYTLPYYKSRIADGEYSKGTLDTHMSRWNVHVAPRWADVPCDAVTALDMQKWFDKLAYRTAIDCNKILRRTFRLVTKYHPQVPNVMLVGYDMPSKQRVNEQDKDPWTPEEMKRIWDACRGKWYEAAIILRGYGGLRPGESLAVTGADVSAIEHDGVTVCIVNVNGQVLSHGYGLTDKTKTEESRRVAFVAGAPADRLMEIVAETGDGYLTNDGLGNWVKQQRVYKAVNKMLAQAGVTMHPQKNMRKTWETAVRWEMKLPPWLSEPLMGHKLPGVTSHYYDKPSVRKMAEIYAEGYLRYPFGE